jgi:hypothetical protein
MFSGVVAGCLLLLCGVPCTEAEDASSKETFIVWREQEADQVAEKILPSDAVADPWTTTSKMPKGRCKDKAPEGTGFEVHTVEGFLGFASCPDLRPKCHNWVNSTMVQTVCPVSCFICDPDAHGFAEGPPCYDSVVTGVRFKNGPQASCLDLANYCNHSTLFYHVQAACRLTCGLCDAHVGHVEGKCVDLESHDEPEFMVSGNVASCSDLMDFCNSGSEAYLIRHKCPRTCGACPSMSTSTHSSYTTSAEYTSNGESEKSDCDRRRRWGFCSTRRRRNL